MTYRMLRNFVVLAVIALGSVAGAASGQQTASPSATSAEGIPAAVLVQPGELVPMLGAKDKPLLLQVGSHVLYAEAHIPGSEYVGATGTAAGIDALRERVSTVKKDDAIVLYCGCCPWVKCPNIRAAYELLHSLGFTRVKVLYLAADFGADWADKGYPVEKGR